MISLNDVINLLNEILGADDPTALITEFQNKVWETEVTDLTPAQEDILETLAYDLDFYEHNEAMRKESLSFYGADRLKTEILTALQKLHHIN